MERRSHRVGTGREPVRGRAAQSERHVGEPRRSGEQHLGLALRGPQRRGEQAPHDTPRIRLLEFAPAAAEHSNVLIDRAAACEVEQRGLPDAGWTLDDDDAARPGPDCLQSLAQFCELAISIDEPRVDGSLIWLRRWRHYVVSREACGDQRRCMRAA